jgi:hypothetical protein
LSVIVRHEQELAAAREVADILIANGLVTSVKVEWSADHGVTLYAAIGQRHCGYKFSMADVMQRVEKKYIAEHIAEHIEYQLRKAWEKSR